MYPYASASTSVIFCIDSNVIFEVGFPSPPNTRFIGTAMEPFVSCLATFASFNWLAVDKAGEIFNACDTAPTPILPDKRATVLAPAVTAINPTSVIALLT